MAIAATLYTGAGSRPLHPTSFIVTSFRQASFIKPLMAEQQGHVSCFIIMSRYALDDHGPHFIAAVGACTRCCCAVSVAVCGAGLGDYAGRGGCKQTTCVIEVSIEPSIRLGVNGALHCTPRGGCTCFQTPPRSESCRPCAAGQPQTGAGGVTLQWRAGTGFGGGGCRGSAMSGSMKLACLEAAVAVMVAAVVAAAALQHNDSDGVPVPLRRAQHWSVRARRRRLWPAWDRRRGLSGWAPSAPRRGQRQGRSAASSSARWEIVTGVRFRSASARRGGWIRLRDATRARVER